MCRYVGQRDVESRQQHNVFVLGQTKSEWTLLCNRVENDLKGNYTSFQLFVGAVVKANGGKWGTELMKHANRILKGSDDHLQEK